MSDVSRAVVLAHLFRPQRSNNHRARVLHPLSYIWLIGIALTFATLLRLVVAMPVQWGSVLGYASSITPAQVVEHTNQERARMGLQPLKLNEKLTAAALAKAQDMMDAQYWAHTSPSGKQPWDFIKNSGYSYQAAGENLARDFANTDDMVAAWMASPTHKANIVNGKYQEIGVAVIDGELQGAETTLVVQEFGMPRNVPATLGEASTIDAVPEKASDLVAIEAQPPESLTTAPAETTEQSAVQPKSTPAILAGALVTRGSLSLPPLFTPLQLSKAFFLAIIFMIMLTLFYDTIVIGNRATMRLVGKNTGHILFFAFVVFLVLLFKGGIIG